MTNDYRSLIRSPHKFGLRVGRFIWSKTCSLSAHFEALTPDGSIARMEAAQLRQPAIVQGLLNNIANVDSLTLDGNLYQQF